MQLVGLLGMLWAEARLWVSLRQLRCCRLPARARLPAVRQPKFITCIKCSAATETCRLLQVVIVVLHLGRLGLHSEWLSSVLATQVLLLWVSPPAATLKPSAAEILCGAARTPVLLDAR